MADLVLIADIGGTNARFALAEYSGRSITLSDARNFRAEDFETVRDAADAYLKSVSTRPVRGCFAVVAPFNNSEIIFTNSHWRFRPDEFETALGMDAFKVVNDFHALAAGVEYLGDDNFVQVKAAARDPSAPILVIGPGTGLGQALIVPADARSKIIATEGGHVLFAPRTEEEFEIKKFIAREHPRVSVERLLSGRGLVNIHRALCAASAIQHNSLQADEITLAAVKGIDPVAVKAVNMFCALLGRVAGDAVLATGARGGVILGGGILPKIQDIFLVSKFTDCFLDKGRMRGLVDAVPVKMIVKDGAALYGAAASVRA